ncbi:MAG TPA: hypothetical protein VFO76_10410, partial [Candidatus Kapabacteria bacterium]|nr:hypothetical protein [Candidatus Kapabacteria bacterium]
MSKREKIIVVFLCAIGIVGCIIPVLLKPGQYPSDDAFFYLQVASNIVSGYGSTFSRITPTNGYHPLWQLVVSGIYFVVGNDKAAGLWVTCFVQQLFFLGIIYWLYRLNEFLHLRYWYIGIPILSVFYLCIGTYASEAHLHGLIFLIACYYFFRTILNPLRKTTDWFLVSILFSILFLARLDSIFTIGVFFILAFYVIKTKQSDSKIQPVLVLTLPFASFVALYCWYNYSSYGHFLPISGAIKGTFPHFAGYFRSLYPMGYVGGIGTLMALIGALRTKQTGRKIIYLTIGAGSTLLMIYVFCFTHHVTGWAWYYVSGVFLLA